MEELEKCLQQIIAILYQILWFWEKLLLVVILDMQQLLLLQKFLRLFMVVETRF